MIRLISGGGTAGMEERSAVAPRAGCALPARRTRHLRFDYGGGQFAWIRGGASDMDPRRQDPGARLGPGSAAEADATRRAAKGSRRFWSDAQAVLTAPASNRPSAEALYCCVPAQIYFRSGWIHARAPPLLNENLPAEVEIYYGGDSHAYERPLPRERWSWAYRREMEGFLQAVRTGEEFLSPGADAVTDVRLMEDIFRKHMEGRGA